MSSDSEDQFNDESHSELDSESDYSSGSESEAENADDSDESETPMADLMHKVEKAEQLGIKSRRKLAQNAEQKDKKDDEKAKSTKDGEKKAVDEKTKKEVAKRANKNRPMELSSKRRVSAVREIESLNKKKVAVDPRFSSLHGNFNEDLFHKSYSFVKDIRNSELEKIRTQMNDKTVKKNTRLLEKMKRDEQRLHQTIKMDERHQRSREIKASLKRAEEDAVRQGKRPFFMKQSDVKKLELVDRYNELKQAGGLSKFTEKRRKHKASKDHRFMPYARRNDE